MWRFEFVEMAKLKNLFGEVNLHLPIPMIGEKIQIENLHKGIDDEEKPIEKT